MLESEFKTCEIYDFTPNEIRATGAKLEDVQFELIQCFQRYRNLIRRRVHLIQNGLTTGSHKSPYHYRGLAGDSYLDLKDGPIKSLDVFKAALEAGFRGIGIYYNGTAYSFHFDLRPRFAFWAGTKNHLNEWDFHALINDPKSLYNK